MRPLSLEQLDSFHTRGFLRLEKYIEEPYCNSLEDSLWECLERNGIDRNIRETWTFECHPEHQGSKLNGQIKQIDAKGIQALYTEDLCAKADSLLSSEIADMRRHMWLITFPNLSANAIPWSVPRSMWHTDCPRLANIGAPGIITLSYVNEVEASGGGTTIVAGSHRLHTTPNRRLGSRNFLNRLKRHEYFRTLFSRSSDRPTDLRGCTDTVDEVDVAIVELTGRTGDVVLFDARILHSIAKNICQQPRIMLRGFFGTKELYQSSVKDHQAA